MEDIQKTNTTRNRHVRCGFMCLVRKIVLFTLPFWALIALYFWDDPFMVLRKYKCYDSDVVLNEEHVGWQIYHNNRDSIHFNSFILGNSCTMAFRCREWEKYLDNGDRAIRLFGNAESMKAISLKLRALDREGAEIKNVLMILDRTSLSKFETSSAYDHVLPADISGRSSLVVQFDFIQAFAMPYFLFPYLKYRITGNISQNMKYMNPYGRVRNPINNDALNPREKMIEQQGEMYWKTRWKEFPKRDGISVVANPVIFHRQQLVLDEIAEVLHRHGTSVRIVISPDYKQKQLNPADKEVLCSIFGKENIYDFSGINEYTIDYHNYYEVGHYRPLLGSKLMERIYKGKNIVCATSNQ